MSVDETASPARGTNRFFFFAAIVLLFMGLCAAAFGGWKLLDGLSTAGWVAAKATITSAEVVDTRIESGKSPRHAYRVTAQYSVDGAQHDITYRTSMRMNAPRIGSEVPVRYDPANPADARRGANNSADVVAGPVVGILGIGLIVGGVLLFRRSRRGTIKLPKFQATRSVSTSKNFGGE